MKRFLVKIGLIIPVIILIHLGLACLADGYTDAYYKKLTGNHSSSLVLGGSRASEGIIPSVFDSVMHHQANKDISLFNFAFTNSDSPYGPVYLEAIKEKLDKKSSNGVFILSVHPWNISSLCDDPNDLNEFRENNLALGDISTYTGNPNYDYLTNGYNYAWGNILLKKLENETFQYIAENSSMKNGLWSYVHDDGWLEVKSLMTDSVEIAVKMHEKIRSFKKREINHSYVFSSKRFDYLKQTITELKKYGSVYLVRLPVHHEIVKFEKEKMADFDSLILELSSEKEVEYFNFVTDSAKYNYSDGNHFLNRSAERFSVELAKLILERI